MHGYIITQSSLTDSAYMACEVSSVTPVGRDPTHEASSNRATRIATYFIYGLFNLLPICSSLDELVDAAGSFSASHSPPPLDTHSSGLNVPPYLVTSRTICARSLASLTIYTCPSIFRLEKSSVIRCCFKLATNVW